MDLKRLLDTRVAAAMAQAGAGGSETIVVPAARPEFGDYQSNGCMAAAKRIGTNPRQLAEKVVSFLDLSGIAENVSVAGPGFINIRLDTGWLAGQLAGQGADRRLGMPSPDAPRTVVVDYSSPNLAKEMHVGHLRSTIIGDALVRILSFAGNRVIRQNHVGDWGTQFGMLLACMQESGEAGDRLSDLEDFYRRAKRRFDDDETFADEARRMVVRLQSGNEECIALWRRFLDISLGHCQEVYDRLGVLLVRDDVRGESSYRDDLPAVMDEMASAGILAESQGARCVFPAGFVNKDNEPLGVIVQKSDGGYLYATTDLAAIRYRVGQFEADRVLYVTDSRQADHFRQVFAVARMAGFVPDAVALEHVPFGMMLGRDGKPFKTREGGTVKLVDLIDEAVARAGALVEEKNPDIGNDAKDDISRTVGIGALKYADLSQSRERDYVFSWERMLALDGNTAPYMQYAYARIRSIFRKGGLDETACAGTVTIADPAERQLAIALLRFPEVVHTAAASAHPHILCGYLYDLAGAFMRFYEECPVLKSDTEVRESRLFFCNLTGRVIQKGLTLLGIQTIEKM